MTTIPFSGTSTVKEIGYVRFKVVLGGQYESTFSTPSTTRPGWAAPTATLSPRDSTVGVSVSRTISDSVSFGLGANISPAHIATLVSKPDPRSFAAALLNAAPSANLTISNWAVLQVGLDSDFCFFSVGASLPSGILSQRIGAMTASVSGSCTFMFGPSKAAWLAMGARLGPQMMAFIGRVAPVAEGAAAGGGAFSTWLGPIGWAIPLALTIQDFTLMICQAAYQRGVQRGHFNQTGMAYARWIYHDESHRTYSSARAAAHGKALAQLHIERYGVETIRKYLERHYRGHKPVPLQGIFFDALEINQIGFRLGEDMLANSENQTRNSFFNLY